jgi:phage-related protein
MIRKGKLYSRLWEMQNKNKDVFDFWLPWQQSNKPFYKYIYDTFIKSATMIGKVEDIRTDLLSMLDLSGDITDDLRETILTSPKRNIGIDVDYRTYYNEETQELVRRSAMPIIEQFDYKF